MNLEGPTVRALATCMASAMYPVGCTRRVESNNWYTKLMFRTWFGVGRQRWVEASEPMVPPSDLANSSSAIDETSGSSNRDTLQLAATKKASFRPVATRSTETGLKTSSWARRY